MPRYVVEVTYIRYIDAPDQDQAEAIALFEQSAAVLEEDSDLSCIAVATMNAQGQVSPIGISHL